MGLLDKPPSHVLVVVEDPILAELVVDALARAGHEGQLADGVEGTRAALAAATFDAALVDLDTRARDGTRIVHAIRALSPSTTVIALLPCGGLGPKAAAVPYHSSVEKPGRLLALLTALEARQLSR